MRKILLVAMIAQLTYFTAWAGDKNVQLTTASKPPKEVGKEYVVPTIPVQVNINNTLLSIHFEKAKQVFVSVVGPEGVVYQKEITTETAKSIYVDLAQYREGQYCIYFLDEQGNQVSGEFLSEKE